MAGMTVTEGRDVGPELLTAKEKALPARGNGRREAGGRVTNRLPRSGQVAFG
ncbi:MAG TPA: hypothetical protein VMA73_30370 [Streptosporangiaceae bacterium]|nr:hypothetical protein [Streptosporangiaceae bacterium]